MAASLYKFLEKPCSIAQSNTDTGRENVLYFYCVTCPTGERIIRTSDSDNFMEVLFEENECLQTQRTTEILLSREWVAKISDVFEDFFVAPRQCFGRTASIGASRRPRICYLAA